jgi:PEP-CTERM motif
MMGGIAAARAAPVLFTWDPAGASPALTGGSVTASAFDAFTYAVASIDPTTGNFTENAALQINGFAVGGVSQPASGLNGTYGLYITFTANGTLGGPLPAQGSSVTGPVTSFTYTLWGDPEVESMTVSGNTLTVNNATNAVALATGSGGGTPFDTATLVNNGGGTYTPSGSAVADFIPAVGESGFFVSPVAGDYLGLDLSNAFTNPIGTATLTPGIPTLLDVSGGSYSGTFFAVPEPASLAVLGIGILGLLAFGRRRAGESVA